MHNKLHVLTSPFMAFVSLLVLSETAHIIMINIFRKCPKALPGDHLAKQKNPILSQASHVINPGAWAISAIFLMLGAPSCASAMFTLVPWYRVTCTGVHTGTGMALVLEPVQ
jgi:hypothetical protein